MKKFNLSLKSKALLGIIFVLLPILITFFIVYNQNRSYLKQRILGTLTVIAEAYEGQVYQFLERVKMRAQDFASDGCVIIQLQKILRGNASAINRLNKHLVKNKIALDKAINTINVLSLEGRVVASTNSDEIGRDLSNEAYFINGRFAVTIEEHPVGHMGLPEITISAPIFTKVTGSPVGVIVNYIPISYLNKLLLGEYAKELGAISRGIGKGAWETMEVYLVNRDKQMITKSLFTKDAVPKQIVDTAPVNLYLTSNKEMAGFYKDYRGVDVAGVSLYIPSMKWVLLVEIDKDEVIAPLKHLLINTFITAAVVVGIIILLYIAFIKKIVKPLLIVSNAAKDIARDNNETIVPVQTGDEIGTLCESFNSMSHDIKARTMALKKIGDSLANAQQMAHIGNWEWDIVKNESYCSDEMYRIFGFAPQEFVATYETFLNYIHDDDREFVRKSVDDALKGKKPYDIEFHILHKDGAVRIIHEVGIVTFDPTGRAIRMAGTAQDITERKRAEEELITEKNKFLAVISSIEDGLTIQDLDYNIIYQNETAKKIFGVRLGDRCYSTYEGKNSICDGCPVELVYKDGKSHISGRRVVLPSGEIAFFENTASPITDASGKIVSCLEITRNITGRKQAEAEMHLLQTITQAVSTSRSFHDAVVITMQKICNYTGWVYGETWTPCQDHTSLKCNHTYHDNIEGLEKFSVITEGFVFPMNIGLPGRAWTGKKPVWVRDVTSDPNYPRASIAKEAGLKTGVAFPVIADNEVVAIIVFYHVKVENINERFITLVSTVLSQIGSIIKRKCAEDELELYGTLFSEISDMAFVLNTEGNIMFVNKVFKELTGHEPEKFLNKPFALLFDEKNLKKAMDVYTRTLKGENTKLELCFKDTGVLCEYRNLPLREKSGNIIGVIGVARDITERKLMEEEQAKLREQLYHAQKLESVGTLAGGIAHDFNNILTAIIGYGSLLQKKIKEDDSSKDYVQKIVKSAERAADLTQGLLAFSRKQLSNPISVYLNDIIKGVECLLERVLREDIKFTITLTDKNCVVMADVGQMEQVLMNLATNARDAMPDGGILNVSTDVVELDSAYIKAHGYGEKGRYALITVSDTGVGMDKKTIERVFEPFFTTKGVGKGTGLGLAMVYGIIKQHNGYINVYSEPGKDTTFRIYLPVIESKVEKEKAEAEVHIDHKGGTETILIAEDEEDVREITKIVLEEHGYTVIEAVDGEDAIDKFRENKEKIHLLLFDMIMPNKNGKEAYKAIKETRPDIKALFMSGYNEDIVSKKDVPKGFKHIVKPVSPALLLKKVEEALHA